MLGGLRAACSSARRGRGQRIPSSSTCRTTQRYLPHSRRMQSPAQFTAAKCAAHPPFKHLDLEGIGVSNGDLVGQRPRLLRLHVLGQRRPELVDELRGGGLVAGIERAVAGKRTGTTRRRRAVRHPPRSNACSLQPAFQASCRSGAGCPTSSRSATLANLSQTQSTKICRGVAGGGVRAVLPPRQQAATAAGSWLPSDHTNAMRGLMQVAPCCPQARNVKEEEKSGGGWACTPALPLQSC